MNRMDDDLLSIQEARILAENAGQAKGYLGEFPQEKLDELVECMAQRIRPHVKELAVMSQEETDYGNWQDKYLKNRFACEYVPAALRGMKCVGVIGEDKEKKTMDIGVPMGVIGALVPAQSPVSTTIYQTLLAVKSGNAIVFSPHPRARKVIGKTLDILIEAAADCGLPQGAVAYLHTVTPGGTLELMNHRQVSLIMNTGVPDQLEAAYRSGKQVIYGGSGNGPAFIERTADIRQAVRDIIASKTFDCGVVSGAEQSIVVDGCIAGEVKAQLQKNGAYFMTPGEAKKLGALFYRFDGSPDPEQMGKAAAVLAKRAGFLVPDTATVLISEEKYVSETNPYSKEKLCPVLAFYIEEDWIHACEKCIELLLNGKHGHTLVIHSKDEAVIRQFALKKPVGRVLVNTPAVQGSMGASTNLFPALTLGSGSAGKGMTADNVSPMNLVYIRKVGYGVRNMEDLFDNNDHSEVSGKLELDILQKILKQLEKEV